MENAQVSKPDGNSDLVMGKCYSLPPTLLYCFVYFLHVTPPDSLVRKYFLGKHLSSLGNCISSPAEVTKFFYKEKKHSLGHLGVKKHTLGSKGLLIMSPKQRLIQCHNGILVLFLKI